MQTELSRYSARGETLPGTGGIDSAFLTLLRKADQEMGGLPAARARVLNLVLCVPNSEKSRLLKRAHRAIEGIVQAHPSRTIIVQVEPDNGPDGVEATPSLRGEHIGTAAHEIMFEQVEVLAKGEAAEHVAEAVFPLLVSDLPVIVWWLGEPDVDSLGFRRLANLADRIIVDSNDFKNPIPGLLRLAALAGSSQTKWCDFAWSRLTGWRELTAQMFDSAATVPMLENITGVEVHYSGEPIQALLLVGWLGSRLGWKFERKQGAARLGASSLNATLRSSSEHIEVVLKHVRGSKDNEIGAVNAVTLRTRTDTFQVRRAKNIDFADIVVDRGDGPTIHQTLPLPPETDASLLSAELTMGGYDLVFEDALHFANEIWR